MRGKDSFGSAIYIYMFCLCASAICKATNVCFGFGGLQGRIVFTSSSPLTQSHEAYSDVHSAKWLLWTSLSSKRGPLNCYVNVYSARRSHNECSLNNPRQRTRVVRPKASGDVRRGTWLQGTATLSSVSGIISLCLTCNTSPKTAYRG